MTLITASACPTGPRWTQRGGPVGDEKEHWIETLVSGRSFMDIGDLWGTRDEKVSVALGAGAQLATMADFAPLVHQLWEDLGAYCEARNVGGYGRLQLDVVELPSDRLGLMHDLGCCFGIVYHVPDPYRMQQAACRTMAMAPAPVGQIDAAPHGQIQGS